MSALDLFASSLGAFILLVMLLFPYYQKTGGPGLKLEDVLNQRAETREKATAVSTQIQSKKNLVAQQNQKKAQLLSDIEAEQGRLEQLGAELDKLAQQIDQQTKPKPPSARNIREGVEFSILGIASKKKSFLIVIDLSASMSAFTNIMLNSVREIILTLKPTNQFAIMGYHHLKHEELLYYPKYPLTEKATPQNIQKALKFVNTLPSKFDGATPTLYALSKALKYNVDTIILLSDGEPTDGKPEDIIKQITRSNLSKKVHIHTVAIGNYTSNPLLTLFLQKLASYNHGDFVGVSR